MPMINIFNFAKINSTMTINIQFSKLFTIILFLFEALLFAQKVPPPPPKPPKHNTTGKNDTGSLRMYGEESVKTFPAFTIPLSASEDERSVYFHQTVEEKLVKLDSTITPEQIISFTKFKISKNQIDPRLLDSLANKAYKQIEEQKYPDAIATAKILLAKSPNNITGHKEISLAYKKTGDEKLSSLHFAMLTKILKAVFKYGDGTAYFPFLVNNFFEGISIYEAAFRCKPNKITLIADKKGRLLGAYNGYSSAMDQILIRYSDLTHWKSQLKKGDYTEE